MSGPDERERGCRECGPGCLGHSAAPDPMTAEHSSEEGGQGLSETERIAAGRIRHGVGSSEDFPGNICHLVSPIVGWMRLRERDGKPLDDLAHTIDRLGLVLDMARAEATSAESAEAECDDLRRRLAAAVAKWSGCWCDTQVAWDHDPRVQDCPQHGDASCRHMAEGIVADLRAALASPSAAQGEGEVARGHTQFTDESGTWCSKDCPRPVAECGALAVRQNDPPLATPAPEADQ